MLLLLLLLIKAATARFSFQEQPINSENVYIDPYSGDQENPTYPIHLQDGSDYMDYKTDDSYEYKQDFLSEAGSIDSEVNNKVKHVILSTFQKCLCGKDDVESADDSTRIVGGKESGENKHPWQAYYPLNFYPTLHLRFLCRKRTGLTSVGQALYQSIF